MHNGKIYVDDINNATQLTFYLPINIIDKDICNEIVYDDNISEKCSIEFSDIYM